VRRLWAISGTIRSSFSDCIASGPVDTHASQNSSTYINRRRTLMVRMKSFFASLFHAGLAPPSMRRVLVLHGYVDVLAGVLWQRSAPQY